MLLTDNFLKIVMDKRVNFICVVSRLNFTGMAIRVRYVVLANVVALIGRS